jgi:hypothetical protein
MLSPFATLRVNSAKHLAAQRDRPFEEFTLSGSEGLRVTPGGSDMHDNAVMLSRSEASRGLSRQALRGVYPER